MAISMVRQPSETPNVTNIDDIIPFRYAYGDQNGYVIGKGQELSYTINGRDFRVNSGRVVLNGVESDVDANGITFTIDNASETRYYVVYYQVNLATNTTDILLSQFSTTGYPVIDVGEDLTTNPSGIARMELYRFATSNGVIQNVEKVVKAIRYLTEYVSNSTVKNSENSILKTDGTYTGFTLDNNGILRVGNTIIPQKQLLWNGRRTIMPPETITISNTISAGDVLEFEIYLRGGYQRYQARVNSIGGKLAILSDNTYFVYTTGSITYTTGLVEIICETENTISFKKAHIIDIEKSSSGSVSMEERELECVLNRIYKVID